MPTLTTDGERILYKVLQRANLCQYFELFISQGGDDVRQLCEAGEEEFLEIMALVGMASKPLHVRRLQKALHEWITNPGLFQSNDYLRSVAAPSKGSIISSVPSSLARQYHSGGVESRGGSRGGEMIDVRRGGGWEESYDTERSRRSPYMIDPVDSDQLFTEWQPACPSPVAQSETIIQLSEAQISSLEASAGEMSKTLPMYAPRPLNMKKPVDKEIDEVMNLPEDHPNRMDLIRKYSAIYGRFDSKKCAEKVLYMHQVLVNEAAAQLCKHRPTLLTRREDLFPLARQVVRDSGLQYSRPQVRARDSNTGDEGTPVKVAKMDSQAGDRSYTEHCLDSSELDDSQTAASVSSQSPGPDLDKCTDSVEKSEYKQEPDDDNHRNGSIKSEHNNH